MLKNLGGEIDLHDIASTKLHIKLESLLKSIPITDWKDQKARPIIWQYKRIAVVFSDVFKEAKKRLKNLLN